MTPGTPTTPSTAVAIARVRAEERTRPAAERLFDDPYAHLFGSDPSGDAAFAMFINVPFHREHVRLRTRLLDDEIRTGLAEGASAVVLLGAGFDCRALRMPELANVPVYEVDVAAQLAEKREVFARAAVTVPPSVVAVAADFATDDLAQVLASAGFAQGTRAVVIAEGLIGYLDPLTAQRMFQAVKRSCSAGSRFAMNYTATAFPAERIAQFLLEAGFSEVAQPSYEDLYRSFVGATVPDGWQPYFLTTARV